MKHFPIGGLIPWNGHTAKILRYVRHPEDGYRYDLSGMSNFDHALLLRCIEEAAKYKVGDTLALPRRRGLTVMARKWSFKIGDVLYNLGDPRVKMGGTRWFEQAYLIKQLHWLEEQGRKQDELEDYY